MTQMINPCGEQRVQVGPRVDRHVPGKEGHRVEGFMLGVAGHVPFQGQIRQKPLRLLFAGQRVARFRQPRQRMTPPAHIIILGGQDLIRATNNRSHPSNGFSRIRRLSSPVQHKNCSSHHLHWGNKP